MTDQNNKNEGKKFNIHNFVVHPERDPHTYSNDISIITLKETVEFNGNIKPLCIGGLTTEVPVDEEVRSDILFSFDNQKFHLILLVIGAWLGENKIQ